MNEKLWTRDFIFISAINFAIFFGFQGVTNGMPLFVSSLGATDMQVSLVVTLTTITALIMRPITGWLLDSFGRKGILLVAGIATTAVIIAYAVFPIIGVILALRFVHGIVWGLSSTATSTIAADIVPKPRFAEGIGYVALFSSLANAISPAIAIALVSAGKINELFILMAAATAIACILAAFIHSKKPAELREEAAQRARAAGAPETQVEQILNQRAKLTLKGMFEKSAAFPSTVQMFVNVAFGTVTAFMAVFGQSVGVTNISLYFVVYALTNMATRPLIGRIIDKRGYYWPAVLSCIGVVATMVIAAFSTNIWMFCLAGVFAGLGFGTAMGTFQSMAVAAVAPQRRGTATSTFFLLFDLGIAIGSTLAGAVSSAYGYKIAFLAMSIFPLIAMIVFIVMAPKRLKAYER